MTRTITIDYTLRAWRDFREGPRCEYTLVHDGRVRRTGRRELGNWHDAMTGSAWDPFDLEAKSIAGVGAQVIRREGRDPFAAAYAALGTREMHGVYGNPTTGVGIVESSGRVTLTVEVTQPVFVPFETRGFPGPEIPRPPVTFPMWASPEELDRVLWNTREHKGPWYTLKVDGEVFRKGSLFILTPEGLWLDGIVSLVGTFKEVLERALVGTSEPWEGQVFQAWVLGRGKVSKPPVGWKSPIRDQTASDARIRWSGGWS